MFTAIYPELRRRCPNLEVLPIEMRVTAQQKAIAKGELDIGFMTLHPRDRTSDSYIHIATEEMLVIIPSGHPLAAKAAPPGQPPAIIDLKELKYEPFVLMDKASTLRSVCDNTFREAGYPPNVLFETNNTGSIVTMVESTLCCGIIPEYYVKNPSDKIAVFALKDHPTWEIAISYRKNSYVSSGANEFIQLAKEFWEK